MLNNKLFVVLALSPVACEPQTHFRSATTGNASAVRSLCPQRKICKSYCQISRCINVKADDLQGTVCRPDHEKES